MALNFGQRGLFGEEGEFLKEEEVEGIISLNPADFTEDTTTNALDTATGFLLNNSGSDRQVYCPIHFPHNATFIWAIVYGDDTTVDWQVRKVTLADGTATAILGTESINTAQFAATPELINNELFGYSFRVFNFTTAKKLFGAIIKYTIKRKDLA